MKSAATWFIVMSVYCLGSALASADELDDYIRTQMQRKKIPGLSLAVVRDGHVIRTGAYGFADLELRVPATPHTVYEIGSISKQFTATVLMMLADEGKVDFTQKISHYLSGLPAAWQQVTLRQLLTHTSGIPDFEEAIGYDSYRNIYPDDSLIKTVADSAMDFVPGEKWHYSNTGYVLLGMLLEKLCQKPYDRIIHERIFAPAGMTESRDSDPKAIIPNRSAGYQIGRTSLENRDPMQPTACKGAGTLVSTVLDMAKWDSVLLADRFLPQSHFAAMWEPVTLNNGTTFPYGYGWFLQPWQGHRDILHSGGTAGFTTLICRFVDDQLTVIILTNCYSTSLRKIAYTAAGLYVPALAPPVYKEIADSAPGVTQLVRKVVESRGHADSLWQESWFTPEYWLMLKPALRQIGEQGVTLGPPLSMALVERTIDGDSRRYRYRVVYKETVRLQLVTLNKEGKISELRGEDE